MDSLHIFGAWIAVFLTFSISSILNRTQQSEQEPQDRGTSAGLTASRSQDGIARLSLIWSLSLAMVGPFFI